MSIHERTESNWAARMPDDELLRLQLGEHPEHVDIKQMRWNPVFAEVRRARQNEADLRAQVATLTKERDEARAQALEEAAQILDNLPGVDGGDGIAAAIRALASPGGRP